MVRATWLLLDADDTLWENNVYFEAAIDQFVALIEHAELDPPGVRAELDAIEARNIEAHGYGTDNFARNLVECFEHLRSRSATEAERSALRELTEPIRNHPIELIDGVPETLDYLRARYRLGLVTKGDQAEQQGKLDRSDLSEYFDYTETVQEKDGDSYRSVICSIGANAAQTWMIGNSPKSDINPALEAGLAAVLVPHRKTWSLEMQEMPAPHGRFLVLKSFRELATIF